MPHAAAAPTAAEPHSFAISGAATPVAPMRAFSVRRSSVNSTHPATPADAVSPAAPQCGSMPSQRGSGRAHRYPKPTVSATRTDA